MISFLTVIISGLFGLLVALSTFWLTTRKELSALERAAKKERKAKLETLYLDEITMLEKVIRYVESRQEFTPLFDEMARQNARMKLGASKAVLDQSAKVSDLIHVWSREYARGQPTRIAGTPHAIISSTQTPHRQKAEELYPQVMEACLKMIDSMKQELQQFES